ncbi:hypothetical protein R3P38DRAFT_3213939 [Favolaschia claudopus]|uniref:Uncharacterized protein n=1 Tax=Favolaschia claudopus TaxID=2862362 RepID=A0AAW0ACQ4_9AGAR
MPSPMWYAYICVSSTPNTLPNPHTMLCSEYSTPLATLKYSDQYSSLTFLRVQDLEYPTLATSDTITHWYFADELPATASGTVVLHGEHICWNLEIR